MKKISTIAAVVALAASFSAPASAQQADPFASSQLSAVPAIAVIGGIAAVIAITAGSNNDSSTGTK